MYVGVASNFRKEAYWKRDDAHAGRAVPQGLPWFYIGEDKCTMQYWASKGRISAEEEVPAADAGNGGGGRASGAS